MSEYQTVIAGGEERVFACRERTMPIGDLRCCTGVVGEAEAPALIARKDLPKCVDLSVAVFEILNQKSTSLCHSFAGTQANEIAHSLAGRKNVLLSAGYLAGLVTGYRNEGAGVDEVLSVLLAQGQCCRDTVEQFDYRGRWPEKAKEEAYKYHLLDAWDCGHNRVFDGCLSNLVHRNPVELGTYAFGGGHAVVQVGYWMRGDTIFAFGPNSWGDWTNWTQRLLDEFAELCPEPEASHLLASKGRGYWVFEERQLSSGLSSFGAFGIQSTVANDDDPIPNVEV